VNTSPVRLEGQLDPPLSRWLWLVKWFLLIPHILILVLLWLAFILTTVAAFFVLLFTGRYPRGIFDFNLGVLRWTWRVAFYSYSALATDRYPPFSLSEEPDYPARLDIDYPESQRRGFRLIGWWLLGIPQYAIAGVIAGGGGYASAGIIGVLVFVVAMLLLFKNAYREDVFDVLMGFNRWCFRALAYGAFLTPQYPPFRFDAGPREPTAGPLPPPGSTPPTAA
jgi:Domain of unknown function (DUF4389)